MGGKITKKILKILLIVLVVFLLVDLLVVGAVFIPPVQQKIVNVVTSKLSEKWNSRVTVEKIYLSPTLKLNAEDFVIWDHHDEPMIAAHKLSSRLLGLNFSPMKVSLGDIDSEGVKVVIRKYKGEDAVNISIWARNFPKKEKPSLFIMHSSCILLKDAYFAYINEDAMRENRGTDIDYGFFEMKELNAKLDDFLLYGSDVSAKFEHLSFVQYTGFKVLNLTCDFKIGAQGMYLKNATVVTPHSHLFMDFAFDYKTWKYYGEFLDSIRFVADVRPSTFNTKDIAYFAPQVRGMDNELLFSAHVDGPINNLNISDLHAKYKDTTYINGNLSFKNIPDFFNAEIAAHLEECTVDMNELSDFMLPGARTIPIPALAKKLNVAVLDVDYNGILSKKITADIKLKTPAEHLVTKLESQSVDDGSINYHLEAQSNGINISKFVPQANPVGNTVFDMEASGNVDLHDFLATLTADVVAQFSHINIKNYPLRNLYVKGNYAQKKGNAVVKIHDKYCFMEAEGSMNLLLKDPSYHLSAEIEHFYPSKMFQHVPVIDSVNIKGFDKIIRYLQVNNEVILSVNSLSCDLNGSSLKTMSGNVFIDGINFTQKSRQLEADRIRLVVLNDGIYQKYHFTSDFFNAYLSTNYNIKDLPNALLDVAYSYCGNLLPVRSKNLLIAQDTSFKSIDIEVTTHRLAPILTMFLPKIEIADGTYAQIHTTSQHFDDKIKMTLPYLDINNKVLVHDIALEAEQDASLNLNTKVAVDHVALGNDNFLIGDIGLESSVGHNHLDYNLSWKNPELLSKKSSYMAGIVDFPNQNNIETKVTSSKIYVKDYLCQFNADHLISIHQGKVQFDHVVLLTDASDIMIDGRLAKKDDSLVLRVRDVDADLVNRFLKSQKMELAGAISANLQLRSMLLRDESEKERVVFGTALIRDFKFNDAPLGNLYAVAAVPHGSNVFFNGALINPSYFPENATLDTYGIAEYRKQEGINAKLNGSYSLEDKELRVTADIDTLPLDFVEPFLSSFSHQLTGDASGKIDFVLNRDSMYFDGKALVREAEMGISILNTIYHLSNQTIEFNRDGFAFNNVVLTDKFGNNAALNGYIHHQKFDNFDLNLRISTPKLLILNTKQKPDFPFFGDAYVSGDVSIYGDMSKLYFVGNNLRTEKGTKFCLPISFADKVSESDVITFKAAPLESDTEEEEADVQPLSSSMDMEFDFTLDVTPVADILLDLDLSAFAGSIATKGEGRVKFTYDTKRDINMFGDVILESGSFIMRFAQLLNKKFYLVPGGTVTFGGSLDDININVKAMYSTTASLADLFSSESTSIRRMPVKTFLQFNGNLSDPAAIDFSFDLPNATSDFKTLFYSTIDTSNLQKKTEQFFSLVMLGKFVPSTPNTNINASILEQTGIGMLTSTLSNFISQQLKYVDLNFNYQNANESTNQAAEYSVSASTSLFNDRTIIEGYFGYVDDQSQNANTQTQFIGDFSIEQKLNEAGTWRVKVFNVTNQDELRNATRNSPYAQGVALIYKQDFNNRKDLIDSFKRTSPKKNRNKKQKKNER